MGDEAGRTPCWPSFPSAGLRHGPAPQGAVDRGPMVPCCLVLDGRLDRYGALKALTAAVSTVSACVSTPYGARLLMVPRSSPHGRGDR